LKFRILNHLEKIQEKNAPKIKRKEKTKAPFFLFNLNSLNGNETNDDTSPEFMNILKKNPPPASVYPSTSETKQNGNSLNGNMS
jgi:hypothetical protein